MATLYNSTTGGAWDTAAAWATTSGGNDNAGPPQAGDWCIIDSSGAAITAAAGDITTSNKLSVTGNNLTLKAGSTNTFGDIATAGLSSVTLASGTAAVTCTALTMGGGTLTGSGAWAINGNLTYSFGTNSHTGAWTQGTGNLKWGSTSIANYVVASGATVTVTGTSYVAKASVPSDATVNLGSNRIRFEVASDNFASLAGTWSASGGYIQVDLNTSPRSNNTSINIGSVQLLVWAVGADRTLTQSAALTCGTLYIFADTVAKTGTLTLSDNLTATAVTLGDTAANNRSGVLNLGSGTHTITSIARGNAANLNDALGLGSCSLTVSGTINGYNGETYSIAATNTSAAIHGGGTGTISNLTVTGTILNATDHVVNGGGNVNVNFGGMNPRRFANVPFAVGNSLGGHA